MIASMAFEAVAKDVIREQRAEIKLLSAFHDAWVANEAASATGSPELAKDTRRKMLEAHQAIRASGIG